MKFQESLITKEHVENLTFPEDSVGKRSKGKQQVTYLINLSKLKVKQVPQSKKKIVHKRVNIAESNKRQLQRTVIAHSQKGYGTQKRENLFDNFEEIDEETSTTKSK